MLCTEVLCGQASIGQLTILWYIEADGKCLNGLVRQLAHCTDNDTRIDSSTEQRSQRYVGHHAFLYCTRNMLSNPLDIRFLGTTFSFPECEIPVTFLSQSIMLIEQPVTWLYFINMRKQCRRSR